MTPMNDRRDVEVDVGEHGALAVVAVAHAAPYDGDASASMTRDPDARFRRIEDRVHLVGRRHAVHGGVEERPQRAQRDEELGRGSENHAKAGEKGTFPSENCHSTMTMPTAAPPYANSP